MSGIAFLVPLWDVLDPSWTSRCGHPSVEVNHYEEKLAIVVLQQNFQATRSRQHLILFGRWRRSMVSKVFFHDRNSVADAGRLSIIFIYLYQTQILWPMHFLFGCKTQSIGSNSDWSLVRWPSHVWTLMWWIGHPLLHLRPFGGRKASCLTPLITVVLRDGWLCRWPLGAALKWLDNFRNYYACQVWSCRIVSSWVVPGTDLKESRNHLTKPQSSCIRSSNPRALRHNTDLRTTS